MAIRGHSSHRGAGTQYRSAIFYSSDAQNKIAEADIAQAAEDYHQIANLKKLFPEQYRSVPALVKPPPNPFSSFSAPCSPRSPCDFISEQSVQNFILLSG